LPIVYNCIFILFSHNDRILIKHLRIEKQWGARRMTNEFPNKAWSIASVSRVINNIDNIGTTHNLRMEKSGTALY